MPGKKAPRRRRPIGRPSIFTKQLGEALCSSIAAGATVAEACETCGISEPAFYDWCTRLDAPFAEFAEAITRAKEKRIPVLEDAWFGASRIDWRAAQALLKVLKPKQYAERIHVHIEEELEGAMRRLREEFANEPVIYERAIAALAGSSSAAGAVVPSSGPSGDNVQDGEAVRAAPAVGPAEGIPRTGV